MNIYLIAGPPGVGKSTSGNKFIPKGTPIIDHDLAAYQYKKEGFEDYQSLASLSANQNIKKFLFEKTNFALELNLGFQSHYDFLRSIANFDRSNKIHLVLFFINNINVCLDRALMRHQYGGHLVEPHIIKEMYENTIPLLQENKTLFHSIKFIDVVDSTKPKLIKGGNIPNWVKANDLQSYVSKKELTIIKQPKKQKIGRKL